MGYIHRLRISDSITDPEDDIMRVGIIGIYHESNTFISTPTTLEMFRQLALLTGDDVRTEYAAAHHEVGGFFEGLEVAGFEAVPILLAAAMPSGSVTAEALDAIVEMMWRELDGAGPLDALLLAPHGAGVAENHSDMDGYWLSLVRERMGSDFPVVATIDPLANLTQEMIDACQAMVAYRSNPHLDQRQRGLEACSLLVRHLQGEVRLTQAAAFPPITINIDRQLTSEEPCLSMYQCADRMREQDGVLSNSIVLGFPYSDVEDMGTSFITVTDDNFKLAQQQANDLAGYLLSHREQFVPEFLSIEAAIDEATDCEGPVCLLDVGDNVGGGSAADGTWIAQEIHRRGGPRTLVCINDPEAVGQVQAAGVGARLSLSFGGKIDDLHGPAMTAEVNVRSIHDGRFTETEPRHGGKSSYNMGPTVVVETVSQLTAILTSYRTAPFSLQQITSCQVDPSDYQILVAKGVHAPVAAYAPVSKRLLRVNTPGSTTADMSQFEFTRRRKPLFPFESIES